MARAEFVEALVADLEPVRPIASGRLAVFVWTLVSWIVVSTLVVVSGPLRAGAGAQLLASPRMLAEMAFGMVFGLSEAATALELGIPGSASPARLLSLPALAGVVWLGLIASQLLAPTDPSPAIAMRPSCSIEVMLFALPSLGLALHQLRRRALETTGLAGLTAGLASASIPAVWMQAACIPEPVHVLTHHAAPMLVVAAVGGLLGRLTLGGR